ncbi:ATP-binding region ATPase domain protein [Desulfovibrio sp. X2]|uniref:sensor histidine kinase n=1 Tax=Desulfovibrio sp. X2 TaxID=941449 RepID=UPI00035892FF|nr:sensor histidine kinase [Desulfovibrio sp. X2]EPR41617.1 ATP-binding region ATPase domain protein [Desulfovibrio sp. X2]
MPEAARAVRRTSRMPTAAALACLALAVVLCWLPWAGAPDLGGPPEPSLSAPIWVDVAWMPDFGAGLTPAEVLSRLDRFSPFGPQAFEAINESPAAWFLLRMVTAPPPGGVVLEMANPVAMRFSLVLPGAGGASPRVQTAQGRFVEFYLPDDAPRSILVRCAGQDMPKHPPRFVAERLHAREVGHKGLALGMFYGGLLLIAAVNILFGLLLGEPGHAWYAASLAFLGAIFFLAFDDVTGATFLGELNVGVPGRVLALGWLFCWCGLVRSFIHTARRTPRVDLVLRLLMAAFVLLLPMAVWSRQGAMRHIFFSMALLIPLLALFAGRQAMRRGFAPARLFLVAWGLALLLPLLPVLHRALHLGPRISPGHAVSLVLLLQAAVFTTSLLDKVRAMQAENIRLLERRRADARVVDTQRRLFREVSHELAGPLSRLGLAIELCGRGGDVPGLVPRMSREHRALTTLRGQMLDLARLDDATAPGPARPGGLVDLTLLAAHAARDAGEEAGPGAVRVQAPGELPVHGDAVLLRRALDNLVRNALVHAGPPVTIRVEKDGGRALLAVRDEGPGVAGEDLERIFEPFERAAHGPRAEEGSGLGLSIVRRVAEAHGGRAWAANRERGGLAVFIELPLPAVAADMEQTESPARSEA